LDIDEVGDLIQCQMEQEVFDQNQDLFYDVKGKIMPHQHLLLGAISNLSVCHAFI